MPPTVQGDPRLHGCAVPVQHLQWYPHHTPVTTCLLYNIPRGQLIGSVSGQSDACNVYVPPYTIDPACIDSSKPNSCNTCKGLVPQVDEFGGVHYQQLANVGEL